MYKAFSENSFIYQYYIYCIVLPMQYYIDKCNARVNTKWQYVISYIVYTSVILKPVVIYDNFFMKNQFNKQGFTTLRNHVAVLR